LGQQKSDFLTRYQLKMMGLFQAMNLGIAGHVDHVRHRWEEAMLFLGHLPKLGLRLLQWVKE
jgi:hypothetical protein